MITAKKILLAKKKHDNIDVLNVLYFIYQAHLKRISNYDN